MNDIEDSLDIKTEDEINESIEHVEPKYNEIKEFFKMVLGMYLFAIIFILPLAWVLSVLIPRNFCK